MTRKKQLWWLIGLSALTAVAQYVIQGTMATGATPSDFNALFWQVDWFLWGARGLIEAWVLVYLFSTIGDKWYHTVILTCFEISLISLIALTLGPSLRALGYGISMRESLSEPWFSMWNFGIAGYTSLMMGAAGFAYRCQPFDDIVTLGEKHKDDNIRLTSPEQRRAAILVILESQPKIGVKEIATRHGVSPQTIYRDFQWLEKQGKLRDNSEGLEVVEP